MQLEIANMVPIYKSGNKHIFSNYRPISVLPVSSKLLEKLMYNRLMNFITNNKLLYKHQFGFQKGRSTYMALILLIDKITEALDKGDCVVGIYLDFPRHLTPLIMMFCSKNSVCMESKTLPLNGLEII